MSFWQIARNLCFVSDATESMMDTTTGNGITWYIYSLIICYIIFWCISWYCQKNEISSFWLFGLMVIIGIMVINNGYGIPLLNICTARGYISFFWGCMLVNVFRLLRRILGKRGIVFGSMAILVSVVLVSIKAPSVFTHDERYNLNFIIFPAILGLVMASSRIGKIFEHKIVKIGGDISFGIYLWHGVFIHAIRVLEKTDLWIVTWNDTICFILAFGVIIISVITHFCVERKVGMWLDLELKIAFADY